MIIESRKVSDILSLYLGTEVKGVKILSDLRERIHHSIPESYLSELMGQGILEPVKVSRSVSEYTFRIRTEHLAFVPAFSVNHRERCVKILATYPRGIGFEEITGISKLYPQLIMLLSGAVRSIDIINPYYTEKGSQKVSNALVQASLKGIKIRMVGRSSSDKYGIIYPPREYLSMVNYLKKRGYPENIDARIFGTNEVEKGEFNLHAKAICVDGNRCYIGSANLTGPSLESNLEIGVLLESYQAISVHKLFCNAWKNSIEI